MKRPAGRESAYTLVELMVVIVIVGIAASLAIQVIRKEPVQDNAKQVWLLVAQARELAVSGGPVDADVAIATGNTARGMMQVSTQGGINVIEVYQFYEVIPPGYAGAGAPGWVLTNQVGLDNEVIVYATQNTAQQYEHAAGWSPATPLGGATYSRLFFSDGSAEGMTLYISERAAPTASDAMKWRVYVFPMTGQSAVLKAW